MDQPQEQHTQNSCMRITSPLPTSAADHTQMHLKDAEILLCLSCDAQIPDWTILDQVNQLLPSPLCCQSSLLGEYLCRSSHLLAECTLGGRSIGSCLLCSCR